VAPMNGDLCLHTQLFKAAELIVYQRHQRANIKGLNGIFGRAAILERMGRKAASVFPLSVAAESIRWLSCSRIALIASDCSGRNRSQPNSQTAS
jgi:hypothetical protein